MFRPAGNPIVQELTKTHKRRSFNLGNLKKIKHEGKSFCAWCAQGELHHGNQKYCNEMCAKSAMAWSYPQKEEGLFFILHRQNWRCNICQWDWTQLLENIHQELYRGYGTVHKMGDKFDWALVVRLKNRVQADRAPEVDHIIPIYKGGQSIGLDNHQVICYTCHKTKTSNDLKGKRNAKI